MIKKINASFEVLSDREKRIEYDRTGLGVVQYNKCDTYNRENSENTEQIDTDPSHNYSHDNYSDNTNSSNYTDDDNINYTLRETNKSRVNRHIDTAKRAMITDIYFKKPLPYNCRTISMHGIW